MSWPEVEKAKTEKRCELVLSGPKISERLLKTGFDSNIFELTSLNYLNISETNLVQIPDEISKLNNLQTLVLHHNKIEEVNTRIYDLDKLKVLDLSRNLLKILPDGIGNLKQLSTLNLSVNQLEQLPSFDKNVKLAVLNLASNKLQEFPDVCHNDLNILSEVFLQGNEIEVMPSTIGCLAALKNLDLSANKIKVLPGELVDCAKIKDLNLKGNPISDRRLLKLIDQCRTKQIIDYVKQNCARTAKDSSQGESKKGKKGNKQESKGDENDDKRFKINVQHCLDDTVKVIVMEDVKTVRPFLAACIIKNIEFTEETFKKFIQLQTRFHDGICQKRNFATIATHDLQKLGDGDLTYTAKAPKGFEIKPLNRNTNMSGADLFSRLQQEAENLRKEKKRNVYSGIHKYLYLLEGQKLYPVLLNGSREVISFPPITNSDITKISRETTSMFIEVTSTTHQNACKQVLDNLLKDMVFLFEKDLTIQQVKNIDIDGNLKLVYPSRNDLIFEDNVSIKVNRE